MEKRTDAWSPGGLKAYLARQRRQLGQSFEIVAGDHQHRTMMWWTLALFMLALWMLGVATSTGGSAIHVLLGSAAALLALLWLRKPPLAKAKRHP
jgi:Flp pilus assembly protein TadB